MELVFYLPERLHYCIHEASVAKIPETGCLQFALSFHLIRKKNLEQKLRKKLKRVNSYHLFVLATKSIVIFIFRLVLAGNCKYGDSAVKKKKGLAKYKLSSKFENSLLLVGTLQNAPQSLEVLVIVLIHYKVITDIAVKV